MSKYAFNTSDTLAQAIIDHVDLITEVEKNPPDGFHYTKSGKEKARSCSFYQGGNDDNSSVSYAFDPDNKLWGDFTEDEINGKNANALNVIDYVAIRFYNSDYTQAYQYFLNEYPELKEFNKKNGETKKVINQSGKTINDEIDIEVDSITKQLELDNKNLHDNPEVLQKDCYQRGLTMNYVDNMKLGYYVDDHNTQWLTIPYYDALGNIIYCRKRNLSYYNTNDNGYKAHRFMVDTDRIPSDSTYEPLWGLHTLNKKNRKTIYIAEGMFDSMILDNLGFTVLSTGSCHLSGDKKEDLIEILNYYTKFSNVTIILDNDEAGLNGAKKMVQVLLDNEVKNYSEKNKVVKNINVILIPETDDNGNSIKDVADYYKCHLFSDDKFRDLLIHNRYDALSFLAYLELKTNDNPIPDIKRLINKYNRYLPSEKIVKLIADIEQWVKDKKFYLTKADIDELKQINKAPSEDILFNEMLSKYDLIYSNSNGFYKFKEGYFKRIQDNEVRKDVMKLQGRFKRDTVKKAVFNHLADHCNEEAEQLNRDFDNPKPNLVTFNNGTLNMDTDEFFEGVFDRENFQTFKLNFDYDPDAECPVYDKFVSDIMGGDQGKINLLNEAGGYIFKRDTKMQKCFWFVGNGSNGKSTFFDVMKMLIGKDNWSSVLPDKLNQSFEAIRMKDKLVNIAPDIKPDIKEVAELLKALTGEGSISGCRKRKDLEDLDIFAKLFMGSNGMPIVRTIDHSIERRIVFIEFGERFTDNNDVRTKRDKAKDIDLIDKLRPEKSGIFNRLYGGFKRVRDNKLFSLTDESRELTKSFMTENNKALAYYNDIFDNPEINDIISNMEVGDYIIAMDYYGDKDPMNRKYTYSRKGKMIFDTDAYTFVNWCFNNGIENILAGNTFSQHFNNVFKEKHPEFKTGRKENKTALIKFTEVE